MSLEPGGSWHVRPLELSPAFRSVGRPVSSKQAREALHITEFQPKDIQPLPGYLPTYLIIRVEGGAIYEGLVKRMLLLRGPYTGGGH